MAKVGNEVELILSLARERMKVTRDVQIAHANSDYIIGYNQANSDWKLTLKGVVEGLEIK